MTNKTKEQAIGKLIERRNKLSMEHWIEPMKPSNSEVGIKVNDGNGNSQVLTESYDPPKPEFKAGIVGTFSDDDGDSIMGAFGVKAPNGYKRRGGTYDWDNFTPLAVYGELEKYKRALDLACVAVVGNHNNIIEPARSRFLNEATKSIESEVGDGN